LPGLGIIQLGNFDRECSLVGYDTNARANDGTLDATSVSEHFSGCTADCAT
jgi:hypothetical protein